MDLHKSILCVHDNKYYPRVIETYCYCTMQIVYISISLEPFQYNSKLSKLDVTKLPHIFAYIGRHGFN